MADQKPRPPGDAKRVLTIKEIAANIDQMDPQEALAAIQVRKQLKELLDQERLDAERIKLKSEQLRIIEEEIAENIAAQEACSHMKERGFGPAIVGQRNHSGNINFLCLICQKSWVNFGNDERDPERLPPHLHISSERIGGIG